jgi:ferredoxin-NADP reductase
MIAGGIGITPIRSVAEVLLASGREIALIYGNRDRVSVALYDELERLSASSGGRLRVPHVMSADPGWTGEQGRVDGACLARLAPDLLDRDVYLCGPPPMMRLVRAALRAAGVPPGRIFDERFAL